MLRPLPSISETIPSLRFPQHRPPSLPPSDPPKTTFAPINQLNTPPSLVLPKNDADNDQDEPMGDVDKPPPGEDAEDQPRVDTVRPPQGDDAGDQPPEDADKPPQIPNGKDEAPSEDDESPPDPSTCDCHASLRPLFNKVKVCNDPTEQYTILLEGLSSPDQFCRGHLRTWTGRTSGLKTNIKTAELLDRVRMLPTSSLEALQQFRDHLDSRAWFQCSQKLLV